MDNYHDPIKHIKFLRQTLSQDKKPIGYFISAGCPLSVNMPKEQWPLIPDVAGLTQFLSSELSSKTDVKNDYDKLLDEISLAQKSIKNIEDILSFIRGLKDVSVGNSVRGFSNEELIKLESEICTKIVSKLDVELPNKESPYHKLAKWISIDREKPVEVFTTNYDLLMEQAFEDLSIPYFDGFVGSRQSFFDLRSVEDDLIPNHWTRLWKIHGSINWFQKKNHQVFRSSRTKEIDASQLIYPSHLKYDQSRKMPFLALMDQLSRFLRKPNALLIISGYSFNDEHINDCILGSLRANPNSMVISMLFGSLTEKNKENDSTTEKYPKGVDAALNRGNLAIWAKDEAIIGTVRGKWKLGALLEDEDNLANCLSKRDDEEAALCDLDLGDFSKMGDFLQALIGYNQTLLDEK